MTGDVVSSIERFQQRGAFADIVDEAIASYEQWMIDDDYEPYAFLKRLIDRMKERRALYASPPAK